ncbi:hypothetical protein PVAP13_7KG229600 [Panicum virgatum]|uniref:Uncharacterized protein n=1 Tax=Panicum virgatum TaxID=38727 RepID=A0A8T0QNR4_PANVG|nr:hypothetical protein PVAP13_7KG229600 [Panicum virgatum]
MASAPVGNKRPRPLAVADDGFLMPTEFLCDALLCSSWSAGPGDRSHQTSPATRAFVAGPRARGGEIRFMDMSGEAATMSSGIRVAEDRTYSLDELGGWQFEIRLAWLSDSLHLVGIPRRATRPPAPVDKSRPGEL